LNQEAQECPVCGSRNIDDGGHAPVTDTVAAADNSQLEFQLEQKQQELDKTLTQLDESVRQLFQARQQLLSRDEQILGLKAELKGMSVQLELQRELLWSLNADSAKADSLRSSPLASPTASAKAMSHWQTGWCSAQEAFALTLRGTPTHVTPPSDSRSTSAASLASLRPC
jgi:hypothetical protein